MGIPRSLIKIGMTVYKANYAPKGMRANSIPGKVVDILRNASKDQMLFKVRWETGGEVLMSASRLNLYPPKRQNKKDIYDKYVEENYKSIIQKAKEESLATKLDVNTPNKNAKSKRIHSNGKRCKTPARVRLHV